MSDNKSILILTGSGLGNSIMSTPLIKPFFENDYNVDFYCTLDIPGIDKLFKTSNVTRVIIKDSFPKKDYNYILLSEWYHPKYFQGIHDIKNLVGIIVRSNKNSSQHEIYRNLSIVKQVFPNINIENYNHPQINYQKKEFGEKIVGIHAGGKNTSIWLGKRWPYYQKLIDKLKKLDYKIAVFGKEGDDYFEDIDYDFYNKLNIFETAGYMAGCNYFISNDSGLMHIAAVEHIPLIAIIGGPGFSRFTKNDPRIYNKDVIIIKNNNIKDISINQVYESFIRISTTR